VLRSGLRPLLLRGLCPLLPRGLRLRLRLGLQHLRRQRRCSAGGRRARASKELEHCHAPAQKEAPPRRAPVSPEVSLHPLDEREHVGALCLLWAHGVAGLARWFEERVCLLRGPLVPGGLEHRRL
jgi:hypothetical protein